MAAFLADHLVETAMQLDRAWPRGLGVQGDLSRQRRHGGFDAIDVLRVEADQTVVLGHSGQHVVESRGR